MIRPLIEFCMSNLASGAEAAKEILEKDPDLDVIDYGCLNTCGECGATLFALVEGEFVSGKTPQELVDNIYKLIKEKQMDVWQL